MNDLISRQAAIDALHVRFSDGFDEDKWWNSTHVLAAIEGLPSAQPEVLACGSGELDVPDGWHWIPCSSGKFPKESGTYTVTAYDGATNRVTYAKYQKRLKRWELTGARAYWRVLAWMPLQEPYREEGDQDDFE